MRNGPGRGAHAHAYGSGLKGWARRRRRAHNSVTVADGYLAVGAEVNKRHQVVAPGHARGNDAGQNVSADKATEAMRKANPAIRPQIPAQLVRLEALFAQMPRCKRCVGKRLHVAAGKQVMHHGVAHQHDLGNLLLSSARETRHHGAERLSDHRRKIVAVERCANTVHHVGAEADLRVQLRFHRQHLARGEVERLGGNSCGAEVDRDAEAMLTRGGKPHVISEHLHARLAALENQRTLCAGLAGEAPSLVELLRQKDHPVRFRHGQGTSKNANRTTAANTGTSAGKFNTLRGKRGDE